MKRTHSVIVFLILAIPQLSEAQTISNTIAPEYKVKCAHNIPLKDLEECQKTVKALNRMTPEQKEAHNQMVRENRQEQYRQQSLNELREINRKIRSH